MRLKSQQTKSNTLDDGKNSVNKMEWEINL